MVNKIFSTLYRGTFDILVDFIMKCKFYHFNVLVQTMRMLYIAFEITGELSGKVLNHMEVNGSKV